MTCSEHLWSQTCRHSQDSVDKMLCGHTLGPQSQPFSAPLGALVTVQEQ